MMGWFSRFTGRRLPQADTADLLTVDEYHAVLDGNRKVMDNFCIALGAVFRGQVRRVLDSLGRSAKDLEEDLINDLFEALLENDKRALRKWNPARGTLRTYMRIFADRRSRDQLRGRSYARSCEKMMEAATLDSMPAQESAQTLSLEEKEFWEQFQRLFSAQVSAEDQALYKRYYVDEERPEDIAAQLGITLDALYKRLSRLRKILFELRDQLLDQEKKGRDA